MKENHGVRTQVNHVTVDKIHVAPDFAPSNMWAVMSNGQKYLFGGSDSNFGGTQNLILAVTMAQIGNLSLNLETTGYTDGNGYQYIDFVSIYWP